MVCEGLGVLYNCRTKLIVRIQVGVLKIRRCFLYKFTAYLLATFFASIALLINV